MKIHGLMKMTLLDYPGKVACTVFLGGCDFRCPFCHNADLLDMSADAIMEEEEFFKFLGSRGKLLDGVAVTGGEPLLRKDIADFLEKIKSMDYPVKLDTNGNKPEVLKELVDKKLVDYVAVDIKNSKERYAQTIGLDTFDIKNIEETVEYLLTDPVDYEFRTTVLREFHDAESFEGIGSWIKGAKRYYLQAFVDRDTVPFAGLSSYTKDELLAFAEMIKPQVEFADVRGI